MANYSGTLRTSYVAVKDTAAFHKWLAGFPGLEALHHKGGLLGFYSEDGELPGRRYPDEGWDGEEIDDTTFFDELATHLAEDQALVILHTGNERLRYLSGWAIVVTSKGIGPKIFLDDIYEKIPAGLNFTRAEY